MYHNQTISLIYAIISLIYTHAKKPTLNIKAGDRIVNGKDTTIEKHPWIVFLEIETSKGETFLCGGTIVGNNRVVTAKHCLADDDNDGAVTGGSIHMGRTDQPNDETSPEFVVKFTRDNVELHPKSTVDVAALKFTDNNTFNNNPHIMPLRVPAENDVAKVGEEVVVSGWGDTYPSVYIEKFKDTLQELTITVHEMASCDAEYSWQFCAGGKNENGVRQDSCQGDSGGPVECYRDSYPQLCGLVSDGPEECGSAPGRYIQVADPEVRWFVLGDESLSAKYKTQPLTIALLMMGSTVAKNHFFT